MQEAVKAELVFHAQSGRIMRMIQPYGANIHIYQATTIFTTGFLNGSTNTVPPEEDDAWNMTLQDGNDYERRSAEELLSFRQVYTSTRCVMANRLIQLDIPENRVRIHAIARWNKFRPDVPQRSW